MRNVRRAPLFWATAFVATVASANPRTNLPIGAFDGATAGAETLGRGNTNASGTSSMGAAASSPAGLSGSVESSLYTTVFVGETSNLPRRTVKNIDPLSHKILQGLAAGSQKGVIYYEALGRVDSENAATLQGLDAVRHIDFAADSLGFAATEKWRTGNIGLSIAYLNGTYGETLTSTATSQSSLDRGYGFRVNVSLRYPTGPFMWGLQLQNIPSFMWWNHHRHDQLPVRMRVGNTWRVRPGMLMSVDTEKRFYREGSIEKNFVYVGNETAYSESVVFRAGVFSDEIDKPDKRHWTGGVTVKLGSGAQISYAIERFIELNESIKQSILSVQVPFASEDSR